VPETLIEMFFQNAERLREKAAFSVKKEGEYSAISFSESAEIIANLAHGLHELGVEKGDHVAILSENRPEWAFSDFAVLSLGAVTVPIYATLTITQVEFILNNSQSKYIIVSQPEHCENIMKIFNNLKTLKRIITLYDHAEQDSKLLHSFDEIAALGEAARRKNPAFIKERRAELTGSDVVSILYTSGTTGEPKGVILTNSNFLSNIEMAGNVIKVYEDDVFLSFLPLSHVFERMAGYYFPLSIGCTIAYAESMQTVGDNMREVKPTIMISVPRLYEKIYGLILANVARSSAVKKMIFSWCVRSGKKYLKQSGRKKVSSLTVFRKGIADRLVFQKLRERTGGRIRFFVSGGAPLAREIGEFFSCAGLMIVEGYGLTETSPVIAANPLEACRFGTVGPPLPGVEVKIAEDGEICTRGPHVMQGYYNNPEGTREVIDGENWFHTGDIGFLDDQNYLTITDRKKNILVTSGGKNIAPQPIENLMLASRYIDQIMMIGDRRQFPAALIVPSFENLEDYFQLQNITFKSRAEMVRDARTHALIEGEINRLSVTLSNYEIIKKFIILENEFTQDDGELTPTLKVKRRIVEQKFSKEIEKIYTESKNADNDD